MREVERQRVAGFRVVVSWPQSRFAPPPRPSVNLRARIAGVAGVLLLVVGTISVGIAIAVQQHAPQPSLAAAGAVGSAGGRGPSLRRSMPVSVKIPAIGVNSSLLHLGINRDGTIQVPSLYGRPNEAAWFKYSVTPGQFGASVIEGHVDTRQGPAVFFRLGALRPGNRVEVTLADGVTAVFRVTGVRQYQKAHFPSKIIYGASGYAALHLITCGGAFDYATGHYLSSTVVFATLASSRRAARQGRLTGVTCRCASWHGQLPALGSSTAWCGWRPGRVPAAFPRPRGRRSARRSRPVRRRTLRHTRGARAPGPPRGQRW